MNEVQSNSCHQISLVKRRLPRLCFVPCKRKLVHCFSLNFVHAKLARSPAHAPHVDLRFHRVFVGSAAVSFAQLITGLVALGRR